MNFKALIKSDFNNLFGSWMGAEKRSDFLNIGLTKYDEEIKVNFFVMCRD
ncbi:hypothetical protein TUM12370_19600 [Salmonella enterica subsp. enterica serovar Choleraesuis]|nr:hypothetical protein TUM12370_19600 [Salmonella enterica subsp. enterica serovar Choleraesuis]